jgi:hypothetical protein
MGWSQNADCPGRRHRPDAPDQRARHGDAGRVEEQRARHHRPGGRRGHGEGFSFGWQEITNWGPIRLTRGQSAITYTAHPAGTTAQIGDYRAFRLDVVTRQHHGRYSTWNIVASSPEVTVTWDATTCVH